MLDLRRLRLLRELAHRGTLAAVADALSYSPSSVSQQLSLLEKEVGVALLEPVGRRVRLTAQAQILVAHAEEVFAILEAAEADIAASLTEVGGVVRLAAFQTVALALVPDALGQLRQRHPLLHVQLVELEPEHSLPALLSHDFDLVVAEEYPGNPMALPDGLSRVELFDDPLLLAWPPGTRRRATLRHLAGEPFVLEPSGSAARQWATAVCRQAGFEPDVRYETSDLLLHLRLVEHGHAVALLPQLTWRDAAPTVPTARLPAGHHSRRLFTVSRAAMAKHPAVAAVRHALSSVGPGDART